MIPSNYILGREPTRKAFNEGKAVTLSAYVFAGRIRYNGPLRRDARAGDHVLYRVTVRAKPECRHCGGGKFVGTAFKGVERLKCVECFRLFPENPTSKDFK